MKIIVIGVAGPSGSGKTTIAQEIHKHYGPERCITISSDNYYKDLSRVPVKERHLINFDHPDSIDFELLAEHLSLLKQGQTVDIPTYDFATHLRTEQTITISPKPIIIVEGILAQHREYLTHLYDTKIFVDTAPDICLIRRIERDTSERGRTVPQIIEQYKQQVKPMCEEFVIPCRERADIIIENSDDAFETSKGVCFDIYPLVEYLNNWKKENSPVRFKLFSNPTKLIPPTADVSKSLSLAAGGT